MSGLTRPERHLPPPPDFSQPRLPRSMWWKIRLPPGPITWRVMKSPRTYPCWAKDGKGRTVPCGNHVRIKAGKREPGVYMRKCRCCGREHWFELLPVSAVEGDGVLRFMWITAEEAMEYIAEQEGKLK